MDFGTAITLIQVFFAIVIGLYFWNLLRNQQSNRSAIERESRKETEKLRHLRGIALSEPLSEKTRPASFKDIVGQDDGLKALRAALCGPNPQHILLYGPPGVGKTAAARLVLEEAKKNPGSPFGPEARFIELDATTARFDERGIADPLIGSVHDPIYQGAGPMGVAGIPQPKPGAVTKAHGGVLFIDEIGELHPIQMNKLLKVLEDRKVFLESAYYSSEDPNVPQHIHDIFQNGLPADFRLVGATTRMPHEIPPAIRSRCLEIFFRPLTAEELGLIALNAAAKISFSLEDGALQAIRNYAGNGREAVNIIQISAGLAWDRKEDGIKAGDVEWVINASQISRRPEKRVPTVPHVGYVNGLAVFGPNQGTVVEIEVCTLHVGNIGGSINVTGMVEEEEIGGPGRTVRRKSSAKGSVENVVTVLRHCQSLDPRDYDIHVNFPGGVPIDGPSAGVAIATAVYSAITGTPVRHGVAMTGELSIRGTIRPVGGVPAKIRAAREAGAHTVLIPKENWQEIYADGALGIQVVPVFSLDEVLDRTLCSSEESAGKAPLEKNMPVVLSAAGVSKKQVVLN